MQKHGGLFRPVLFFLIKIMQATLKRIFDNEKQTIGVLTVEKDGEALFRCCTLELPNKGNQKRISCIPKGVYPVRFRDGVKEGSNVARYNHYEIQDVPNRSWILFHAGNYHFQILGCILVGESFTFLNNDDQLDVTNSRNTLRDLLEIAPSGFVLNIT